MDRTSGIVSKDENKSSVYRVRVKQNNDTHPTASCIKRMSEHPTERLKKMLNKRNECKKSALEFRKQRQILRTFALKNIKLAKQIWLELLSLEINPGVSFVDYVPEDHSYKVKPAYLEVVKKLVHLKMSRFGVAEKIIVVPEKYTITSLSFQNFLVHNYYCEEIINALLMLYQEHAHSHGYIIFNTFAYHSVYSLVHRPEGVGECSVTINDSSKCKGIIFPLLVTNPYNEFIAIWAKPKDKEIILYHYNSRVYNSVEEPKVVEVLENIIKYVEIGIITPKEDVEHRDITLSKVSTLFEFGVRF